MRSPLRSSSRPAPETAACRPIFSAPRAAAIPRSTTRSDCTSPERAPAPQAARATQPAPTPGLTCADRLASSSESLPVIVRRRARSPTSCSTRLPVHQVVMRADGSARGVRRDAPATAESCTRRRAAVLRRRRSPITSIVWASSLEPGWRVEINLRARRLDPRRRAARCAAGS